MRIAVAMLRIDPKGQDPEEVAIGFAMLATALAAPEIANVPERPPRLRPNPGIAE